MLRAIELAEQARGYTRTNPLVGAVIVKDGRIIGEGYHHFYGGDHAEVDAIKNACEPVAGAEMFVSLEPCCHRGKTPPCTEAILAAGIRRVCCAMADPNPKVGGKGISILRDAGVEVAVGECADEARKLNRAYIKYITTGLPYVTLKVAQTLDGKVADAAGNSKWITSEESRRRVHLLRSQSDAVLVGGKTARSDNPFLTSHGVSDNNPLRLVLTSRAELDKDLHLLTDNSDRKSIIVTGNPNVDIEDVETWRLPADSSGMIDLTAFLRHAADQRIMSLLVEGGAALFSAFIRAKLVDRFFIVVAPKLLGNGIDWFVTHSMRIDEALGITIDNTEIIGNDWWIEAYPR